MPHRELPVPPPPEKFATEPYRETDRRDNAFTVEERFEIRSEQEYYCAACGKSCRGEQFHEKQLSVHHIIPIAKGGSNELTNGIGLCPDVCHPFFDMLIFEYGIPATVYLEAIKTLELPLYDLSAFVPEKDKGHKHLRKGKKAKSDKEKKRHIDRINRNKPEAPQPPSTPLPHQADIFITPAYSAD